MRRCGEPSNESAALSPSRSSVDYITNTSGYDFRKGHLIDAVVAEPRNDKPLQHAPVSLGCARLQSECNVLSVEPVGEFLDRDDAAVSVASGGRVLTIPGPGDDPYRSCARLLAGEHGAGPEADAARSTTGAVLHDISLTAARQHTQPEAGEFVVPDEMLSLFIFCSIDRIVPVPVEISAAGAIG
jgi:hypothetical protein